MEWRGNKRERPAGGRVYVGPSTSVEQAGEWSMPVVGGVWCGCALLGVWYVAKQALCVNWKGRNAC
jgi:hypothetical protein